MVRVVSLSTGELALIVDEMVELICSVIHRAVGAKVELFTHSTAGIAFLANISIRKVTLGALRKTASLFQWCRGEARIHESKQTT
jgi:hypothetical protein